MPRKTIRIESMNAVKEAPVEPPVETLPERSNCIELSDDMLVAITEEVKGDIVPVAKPKRTRRPKAKAESRPSVTMSQKSHHQLNHQLSHQWNHHVNQSPVYRQMSPMS
jgi:hypothetical protein